MENTSLEDCLIRSRITILNLLERRGYETTPYRKLSGEDLPKLLKTPQALTIQVVSKTDPTKKALVIYMIGSIKGNVGNRSLLERMLHDPSDAPDGKEEDRYMMIKKGDELEFQEVMVVYYSKLITEEMDTYDKAALEAWRNHKLKLQFFPMVRLVNNPLDHELQPKFEIVPPEEHETLLKEWCCRSSKQFPVIRFHNDPVARCLGLVPGDIVKITKPSPTAGEYIKYRVCAP